MTPAQAAMPAPRRILLIRRDNIGDLVLTTPLIRALRTRFPESWIAVLGNSYNTPVLAGHPDLDAVYAYDKAKHVPERSRLAVYADTARLLWRLRRLRIDLAIVAGDGVQPQAARLARWIGVRALVGFVADGRPAGVTLAVEPGSAGVLHASEDVFRLGAPLGITGTPGPCVIAADPAGRAAFNAALKAAGSGSRRPLAVHISARRPRQRWPARSFAAAMRALAAHGDVLPVLLWAPGDEDDPRHPGDNRKAEAVVTALGAQVPCLFWPTPGLASLTGALSRCELMLCADGGAMHIAAGLGVPVVALFGDSSPHRWHPWGVAHEVVRANSGDVADIDTDAVAMACRRLLDASLPRVYAATLAPRAKAGSG